MARLPIPGKDSGTWGNVLNDYLSQSHKSDGSLKDDSVGSAQLRDNSVTAAAIADNAVTDVSIQDGAITETLLESGVQTKLNAASPTWSTISGKPSIVAAGVNAQAARNAIDAPSTTVLNLKDFGAVGDGTYDSVTHATTGTDNTAAINAALATGKPVLIPPGMFYYTGVLHTNVSGSGLIGSGKGVSFLITDQSLDYHIGVVTGTLNTTWTDFSMIGPFITNGADYNRALLIGMKPDLSGSNSSSSAWDATGTWIDNFATYGYCVGLHVAVASDVQFGSIEVYEAGNSRAEPGAYGITCSGSRLYGKLLRCINTTTLARHALYYNGLANDCFVEVVEAKGFDFAAIQNRATAGGGQRNGFGKARFERCNINEGGFEPVTTLRGVVNFVCANDVVVDGAGGCRIGDYTAINCGGFPGPSLRYMPNSRCGTVHAYGHNGQFIDEHYGSHIYRSDNVEQPKLIFVSGFDAAGLNDATLILIAVDDSDNLYGGGVRMHSGGVFASGLRYDNSNNCTVATGGLSLNGTFTYGLVVDDCTGLLIPDLTISGTYTNVVRWIGDTDLCLIDNVRVLTEPTGGLFSDVSILAQHNRVLRAPGYDMKEVSTGTTIDAAGFREIRLNYSSGVTITNLTGLQQSVLLKVTSMNANSTLSHIAGGVGQMELSGKANRAMGTRSSLVLTGHITGSGGSYTYRCIEVNPNIEVGKLVGDTSTVLGLGSINLGHASDTTITRSSAGQLAVENNPVGIKVSVPASATAAGVPGQWAADASYYYACIATNTWVRSPLSTW